MKYLPVLIIVYFLFLFGSAAAQKKARLPKGKLFIMGGGDRPPSLMKSLLATAAMVPKDYVIVLPRSSEYPDTAYYYFKTDFETICKNAIVNFNFTKENVSNKDWLVSLTHAKLIFITGGDQDRFMKTVLKTPIYKAIYDAYDNGATIAGTSAGAAVMSQYMITGNELTDTIYHSTFPKIHDKNIEIKEGLGLLKSAIIDQHFIVRSRYNRLLSALAKYPSYSCIGIDEATAIIVQSNTVKVSGESQVIVMRKPVQLKITSKGLIKIKDIEFSIYTDGDEFTY